MAVSPRRIMSYVLLMSALKLSNPIQIFIQMKTYNFPQLTLSCGSMTYFLAGTLRSKCCRDHTPGTAAVNGLQRLVRVERYTFRESERAIKGYGPRTPNHDG